MSAHILVWICTNAPLLAQKGWALYDYETRVRGVQVAVHREGEKPGDKKRKLAPRLVHLNDHHLGHLESHDEKPHEEEHSDDNDDAKSVETTLESAEKENKPGRVFLISKDSAIEPHTLAGEVLEDWFKWGSIPQFGENGTISGYQRTQPGYLLVHGAGKSDGTSSCHWLTSCMGKLGCGNGGKDFDAMQMIITYVLMFQIIKIPCMSLTIGIARIAEKGMCSTTSLQATGLYFDSSAGKNEWVGALWLYTTAEVRI